MRNRALFSTFSLLSVLLSASILGADLDTDLDIESYVSKKSRPFISKVKEAVVSVRALESFRAASEVCGEMVTPLYKHQGKKEYHVEYSISFERTLPGPSQYCQVKQPVTSKCSRRRIPVGTALGECLWQHQRCLMNKRVQVKLLSDLYQDECGNILRGFSWINYASPGEDMMDSVSPGHTLRLVEMFSFGGQYEAGETYPVPLSSFVFFAEP